MYKSLIISITIVVVVIVLFVSVFHFNLFSSNLIKQIYTPQITQNKNLNIPITMNKISNLNPSTSIPSKIYNTTKKVTSTPSKLKQKTASYQYKDMTLSQLLNINKSLECTISSISGKTQKTAGTIYTDGTMLRSNLSTIEKNPENTDEIIKNDTVYIWDPSGQGLSYKVPLSEIMTGKTNTGQESPIYEVKQNYDCKDWTPNNNMFTLPNLNFYYIDQILAQISIPQYITISSDETLRQIFSGETLICTFTDDSRAPEVVTKVSIFGNNGNIRETYNITTKTDKTTSWDSKYMMYTKNTLYEWNYALAQKKSITPSQFDQISPIFYNHQNISNLKCKTDEIGAQSFSFPRQMPVIKEVSEFTIF